MTTEQKFSVTFKVAEAGSNYEYQEDKADHKKGDIQRSIGGHVWYSMNDGVNPPKSYGFSSAHGEPVGEGAITTHDDVAYKQTIFEATLLVNEEQFRTLQNFSEDPDSMGFDSSRYKLLTQSCVDFAFKALNVIGYNDSLFEGLALPGWNITPLKELFRIHGAEVINDNITRRGDYYEAKDLEMCLWRNPADVVPPPKKESTIDVNINTSPQPQQRIEGESQAQQDVANGYIKNTATDSVFALGGILEKTDFVSTQQAGMAAGAVRPGEVQIDPNIRPNTHLSSFYGNEGDFADFSVRNALALNGLTTLTAFNTYVDPLLLDLTGAGVHMTDLRDAVVFDTDHSGRLRRTGWADRSTGMLVIDDGSGQIVNVSQMFSEYYGGAVGVDGASGERRFKDGLAALASEDANQDGVIDAQDPVWSKLRVWVDASHDAAVDGGELKTLDELGITQISVQPTANPAPSRDGNQVLASGTFTINGEQREMLAVSFLADAVGNTVVTEEGGSRITSITSGADARSTTAYASHASVGESLDAAALGVDNLIGGSGDDTLTAAPQGSWLAGGAGSNTYNGGVGDDVFVISASDDPANIHGNGGRDTAIIVGSKGVELNLGKAGLIMAQGGDGHDKLVSGSTGGVFLKGGSGTSLLVGGGGTDVLVGGSGRNTILGGSGKALIYAGPQGDTIYGAERGSIIHAGGGADRIFGGLGDDVIEVGRGNAVIDGDGGVNVVTLHGTHGEYRITPTAEGFEVADTVAGRDGTVSLKNIQKLNFSNISAVDLLAPKALPVNDVLKVDHEGMPFQRSRAQLISAASLLSNDLLLGSQGGLRLDTVGDALGGSVALTEEGHVLFTPEPGYTGMMSFKYGLIDAQGNPSAAVVSLDSGESAPMRASVTLLDASMPDDPLAPRQWYLSDVGILPVWQDYTGKGVRIAMFEPGGEFATAAEIFDIQHPDLVASVDQPWLNAQRDNNALPALASNHATMVAGVMVAARNDQGGVGVAHGATLSGFYLANKGDDLTGLGNMVGFDVANHSWGFKNDFALGNVPRGSIDTSSALLSNARYAAHNGRGGLGTVVVTAGGNQRATGGSAQGSLTNNNRFSIQVGAINAQADLSTLQLGSAPFSNPGASLLVSAPGSNVLSTSRQLQTERGSTFGSDYSAMQGTSFAAPIVSGIVALMLEANPNLGYRDVQQILALSARRLDDAGSQWSSNGARHWNGGGLHASHDYGFGKVDARAAVRLAESWTDKHTGADETLLSASSGELAQPLAAGATLRNELVLEGGLKVEHVEVELDANVGRLGDISLTLVAPSGVRSVLLDRPGKAPGDEADVGSTRSGAFVYSFMSTHHLGETSAGTWTLEATGAATGEPITLNNWALRAYGSTATLDDTYFYTDEFALTLQNQPERGVLDDAVNGSPGGRNTLNFAAVSGNVEVSLETGAASVMGAALTLNNPATLHQVITGDGDDTLAAGADGALLHGGRGRNTLTGGSGQDTFVVQRRDGGMDTVQGFEADNGEVISLVGFAGKAFADLVITQQEADVRVDLGAGQHLLLSGQTAETIGAGHFQFQDRFMPQALPVGPTEPGAQEPGTTAGTVVLNGGGSGVSMSTGADGQFVFALAGTVYSPDGAAPNRFVVSHQPQSRNYGNALRGFRHGVDKIDLSQVGVTHFEELSIVKQKRGTINGISQIHGVDLSTSVLRGAEQPVQLLYLDTLEVAQLDANDFIFASAHLPVESGEPEAASRQRRSVLTMPEQEPAFEGAGTDSQDGGANVVAFRRAVSSVALPSQLWFEQGTNAPWSEGMSGQPWMAEHADRANADPLVQAMAAFAAPASASSSLDHLPMQALQPMLAANWQ